jgi:hypothetical protein
MSQSPQLSFIRIYDKEVDPDLDRLDELINDEAIDAAFFYKIAWRGRKPVPISRKVRAHILKATKRIPSFNQLCFELKQRKAYRRFCHLKNKKDGFCPATLTNFRQDFSFRDRLTLMSIFIKNAAPLGFFQNCSQLHITDSTEMESPCRWEPIEVNGCKVEKFRDPTASRGRRSAKKGKSRFFVGHRKHSLACVLPHNKVIALLSVVASAHQQDVHFLLPLLYLAQALGLDVKYVVADLAYIDSERKRVAKEKFGVVVHTDKKVNSRLPEMVDQRGAPYCIAGKNLQWLGLDQKSGLHYYGCGLDEPKDCPLYGGCEKLRVIDSAQYPVAFGQIPVHLGVSRKMLRVRKLKEPGFWRDRNKGGLARITLLNKDNAHFLAVIADVCDLLDSLAIFLENKRSLQKKTA